MNIEAIIFLILIIAVIIAVSSAINWLLGSKEEVRYGITIKQDQNIKEIDSLTVTLLYVLSFFIPLAGFIVGAIYASKESEHYKIVGRNCLIWSAINILFGIIFIVMLLG
mgnify:CR=1 FL=1